MNKATPTTIKNLLNKVVSEAHIPGIMMTIHDGDTTAFESVGVADIESKRPRHHHDRFRVGSASKAFTSIVTLQLVDEDVFTLDDTVNKLLPGILGRSKYDGDKITLRQLLNHTSGIFPYSIDPELLHDFETPAFLEHRYDYYTPEQLVKIALEHAPQFAPGEGWGYTNTGFILAGMIIERATGRSLSEEIEERITKPLGLQATYLPVKEVDIQGPHSRYYSRLSVPDPAAAIHDVTDMSPSSAWAAGGMISSLDDLCVFLQATLRGKLVSDNSQKELMHFVPTSNWVANTGYGLGIFCQKLSSGKVGYGIGGKINGSWTYAMADSKAEHIMSVNINGDWTDGPTWQSPIDIFTDLAEEVVQ